MSGSPIARAGDEIFGRGQELRLDRRSLTGDTAAVSDSFQTCRRITLLTH